MTIIKTIMETPDKEMKKLLSILTTFEKRIARLEKDNIELKLANKRLKNELRRILR